MSYKALVFALGAVIPAQTPYVKWLNEDAAFIIQDVEIQAFHQLSTDQERNRFIEQFWIRRDPTPDTPENERKVEHYRRIEYANLRFGSQSAHGWRTDRGRTYIVMGPPDEVEAHVSVDREVWGYRPGLSLTFIGGVLTPESMARLAAAQSGAR